MDQRTLQAQLDAVADVDRPDDLEVATLTTYDIPALAALHLVAYDRPEIAENLWEATDEMRMSFDGVFGTPLDDSFIGAWIDGELVGALLCVTDAPIDDAPAGPFVIDLMVDPEHRRRGIAKVLVSELARRARSWGHDSVALRLDPGTLPAGRLYELLGFEEVDEEGSTRPDPAS